MQKTTRANRGICLALAAFFLVPHGSGAAAVTRTSAENIVNSSELYGAMSARAGEDAAARESVQKLLGRSEVRRVAARTGLDLKRVQAALPLLSGEELLRVADQAQRVDETLAGGGSAVVSSSTLIIALLIVLLLVGR
jgi:hypothetical protein